MNKTIPLTQLLNNASSPLKNGDGTTAGVIEPNRLALLSQADLLLLLAQMFSPPSAETPEFVIPEIEEIEELLQNVGFSKSRRLLGIFQQIRQDVQAVSLDSWMGEYNRLFETSVACPINETGIIRRSKGAVLADINGFYNAFGFILSTETSEKSDHLRAELEFVALLLVMLAQTDDDESLHTTYNALSAFSFDHIGEWLPEFCRRLGNTTILPFYQSLAEFLDTAWEGIVEANHLPTPNPEIMEAPGDDGTPYECVMAGD